MISGFRLEADVDCPLLGYYTASKSNFLQTSGTRTVSCPEMSVRNYHYSLPNSPEECNSQHNKLVYNKTASKCGQFTGPEIPGARLPMVSKLYHPNHILVSKMHGKWPSCCHMPFTVRSLGINYMPMLGQKAINKYKVQNNKSVS